ncbi:MAG: TIGR01458 family HAD-type hydrolase [Halothiobacillaceae bacterium]
MGQGEGGRMRIQAVLLDIGGVLLDGEAPLPGAAEALDWLRVAGLPFMLLTNTTRTARAALLERLAAAGLVVEPEALLTPAIFAREWLIQEGRRPLLLIHPGLRADFSGVDESAPDVVVVGDAGEGFTYAALNAAFRLLMGGAPLIALSGSRYFREGGELFLDAGPFVRLLEEASGMEAMQLGKPGATFFRRAVERLGVSAEAVLMIGDDVQSDVQGARAVGLQAMLVRTGKYRPGDERACPPGAVVAADVLEAVVQVTALHQG